MKAKVMRLYVNEREVPITESAVLTPPFHSVTATYYAVVNEQEPAHVRVIYDCEVKEACLRPLSAGVTPQTEGNCVAFTLSNPQNVSLEINGGIEDALLLFFDMPREEKLPEDYTVIRFSEGETDVDILEITEDKTLLYLEEGAVVHGKLRARGVDGLIIAGYGMITMRDYQRDTVDINTRCVDILDCKHVTVKNILITDSCQWSFRVDNCEDVLIDNVRVIGYRINDDGFDICGSRRVHMKNCFVRSYDDAVSVKGLDTGNIEDILVEKCVFWNDMARSMNVGSEISCDWAENITFRDIDIIHNLTSYPICQIHNGDRGRVRGVTFEDIRVEHAPNAYLFDLRIYRCFWNRDTEYGSIENVLFKNIKIGGKEGKDYTNLIARMEGKDEEHAIRNVRIEGLTVFGKKVMSEAECGIERIAYAEPVQFLGEGKNFGLLLPTLSVSKPFRRNAGGAYRGSVRLSMKNENEYPVSGSFFLKLAPKNLGACENSQTSYRLLPGECMEKEYELTLTPGKYLVQTASNEIGMKNAWCLIQIDGELSAEPVTLPMTDYDGNDFPEARLSFRNGFLILESEYLRTHTATVYTALPVPSVEEEALFTAEECDFGEVNAVKLYHGKEAIAYELGNPYEISMVYLNMPKTQIHAYRMTDGAGFRHYRRPSARALFPLTLLGLPEDCEEMLLEIAFDSEVEGRYEKTLFRSVMPQATSHLYAKFKLKR